MFRERERERGVEKVHTHVLHVLHTYIFDFVK
jgi:hypothetical protein